MVQKRLLYIIFAKDGTHLNYVYKRSLNYSFLKTKNKSLLFNNRVAKNVI